MKRCRLVTKFFSFLIIFVISCLSYAESFKNKINIAVVHSYTKSFYWSKNVLDGFIERLSQTFEVSIVYENELDSKNNPNGVPIKVKTILKELVKTNFEILFITDDDALNLVGKKYFNSRTIKVVIAGINNPLTEFGDSELQINKNAPSNLSGVLERYDILPLIKLIPDLVPSTKSLVLLFDDSTTSNGVYLSCIKEIGMRRTFGKLRIKSIDKSNDFNVWKKRIESADPDDALLIFPFSNIEIPNKFRKGNLKNTDIVSDWITKHSKTPEFATSSLASNNNFFATVGINPFEHGQDAALAFINSITQGFTKQRIKTTNYARLRINPERASQLSKHVPFELFSYSYALTKGVSK